MAKQNVQQDILNFLNRNAAVAQKNNFDFADWENNLKKQLDGNNRKGIVTLIANYIEMVMDYCTNKTCKEQITYSRMYFNRLLPFLQRLLKPAVLIEVTKLVLDTIIVENTSFWCVKKELLKVYNNWFLKKELVIRNNVIEQLLPIYLYKLMDSICTNGDYDLQKTVIETIHGLYPSDILLSKRGSLIPGSLKLDKMFLNIHSETFNKDCRLFLNAINKKNEEKIYSIFCKYVQIGGTFSELPRMEEGGLWVDFNLEDKAISWYYKGHSLDEASLELVTLFASDINTYSWEIDGSELEEVKLHLKLKGSLLSSSLNDDSFVRQAKSVTITAENDEFVQNLAYNILPKIFENVSSIKDKTSQNLDNYGIKETKSASYTVPSKSEVSTNYKFLLPTKKRKLPLANNQDEVITILSSDNSLTITSPQKTDPPLTNILKEKSQKPISKNYIKILSNEVVRSMKENVHKDSQGSTILPEEVQNLADLTSEESRDRINTSNRSDIGYKKCSKVLTESINSAASKEKSQNVSNDMGGKNYWSESELAVYFESANEYIRSDSARSEEILKIKINQPHENVSREFNHATSSPKSTEFSTEMYKNIHDSQLTGGCVSLTREEESLQDGATDEEIVNICENIESKISENFETARESLYWSGSEKTLQDGATAEEIVNICENIESKISENFETARESLYWSGSEKTLQDGATAEEIVNICENIESKISENFETAREGLYWSGSEKTLQDDATAEVSSKHHEKINTFNVPNVNILDNLTRDLQSSRASVHLTITEEISQDEAYEETVNIKNPRLKISENFESARESLYWSGSEKNVQDEQDDAAATEVSSEPQDKISTTANLPIKKVQDSLTRNFQFPGLSIGLTRSEKISQDKTPNEEIVNTKKPKSKISENIESARENLYLPGSEKNVEDDAAATEVSSEPQDKISTANLPIEKVQDSLTSDFQFPGLSIGLTRSEKILQDKTSNEEIVNTKKLKSKISGNIESARENLNLKISLFLLSEKIVQDNAAATEISSEPRDKISTANLPIEKVQDSLTRDFQFPGLSIGLTRSEKISQDKTPNEEIVNTKKPKSKISENIESARENLYLPGSEKNVEDDAAATEVSSEPQDKISTTANLPIEKVQDSLTRDFQFPGLSIGLTRSEKISQDKTPNEEIVNTKKPKSKISENIESARENLYLPGSEKNVQDEQDDAAATEVSSEPQDKISTANLPIEKVQDSLTRNFQFPGLSIGLTRSEKILQDKTSNEEIVNTKKPKSKISENIESARENLYLPGSEKNVEDDAAATEVSSEPQDKISTANLPIEKVQDSLTSPNPNEFPSQNIFEQLTQENTFSPAENENCSSIQSKAQDITSKKQTTENTKEKNSLQESILREEIVKINEEQNSKSLKRKNIERAFVDITNNKHNFDTIETLEECEIRQTIKKTKNQKKPNANVIDSIKIVKKPAPKQKTTSKLSKKYNFDLIETVEEYEKRTRAEENTRGPKSESIFAHNDSDSSEDNNLQTNVRNVITVIADVHVPAAANEIENEAKEIRKDIENPKKEVAQTSRNNKRSNERVNWDEILTVNEYEKRQQPVEIEQTDEACSTASTVFTKKRNTRKLFDPNTSFTEIKQSEETIVKEIEINQLTSAKNQSKIDTVNAKKDKTVARKSGKKATGVTSEREVSDEYKINRKFLFEIKSKKKNRSKEHSKKRKYDDIFPGTSNLKGSKKLKGAGCLFHGKSKDPSFGLDAKLINKTLENGDNLSIYNEKCIAEYMSFLSKKIITWSCKSYYKGKFVEIHSKNYFDKYLVILFYPLDFGKMPHCESPKEILEINENYEKFRRLKTEVLCCSVDTVDTHKRLIESLGINDLKFPLLEDPTHEISNTFHMYCAPYKHSYRGCFIINRKGYIAHYIQVDFTSSIPLEEIVEGIQMASNDC